MEDCKSNICVIGPNTPTRDLCSAAAGQARKKEAGYGSKRDEEMVITCGILFRDHQRPFEPYDGKPTAKLSVQDLLSIKCRCRRGSKRITLPLYALTKAQPTAASLAIGTLGRLLASPRILLIPNLPSCISWSICQTQVNGIMPHHSCKHGHNQVPERTRPGSLSKPSVPYAWEAYTKESSSPK